MSSSSGKKRRREAEPPLLLMGGSCPPAAAANGYCHHDPHGEEEPAATSTASPAAPAENGAFAVHWTTVTTADIEVTAPDGASFCLEGRGTIENLSSRDRPVEILGAALVGPQNGESCSRSGGEDDRPRNSDNSSKQSHSNTKIDFDSPPWTSWVTLHLNRGDRVRITGSSSSSAAGSHGCSFAIREAHDAGARPTVVPPSWKAAVDHILEDYHHQHQRQQKQQQQQQPNSFTSREEEEEGRETESVMPDDDTCSDNVIHSEEEKRNPAPSAAVSETLQYASSSSYFQQDCIADSSDGDGDDDDDRNGASSNSDSESDDNNSANANGFAIVVCGAKGVGKSTCVRYCLNRLLSSGDCECSAVAVLDADPGQPEFAAPGVLQLTVADRPTLQSPHRRLLLHQSNNCRMVQSHYLGSVTSQADPALYVRCVASLAAAYRRLVLDDDSSAVMIPLLVNLDGWVQGLGFQILATLLQETLQPRHVIQIAGDSVSKSLDVSAVVVNNAYASTSSEKNCRLHECWAYNSARRGELPAKKKKAAVAECNTTNGVPDDGNAKTDKTYGNPQVSSSQSVALTRTSSLASYDNAEDVPSDDVDDDEEVAVAGAAARQHSSTSQNGVSVLPAAPSLPASVFRQVRLVSYFVQSSVTELDDDGETLASLWDRCGAAFHGVDDPDCEIAHALAAARPYVIPLDAVQIRFASSSSLHGDIRSPHALLDLLNASIVGLCQEANRPRQQQQQQHGGSDGANTAPAALLPCVGLGLVRAVDPVRRTLYILTPCPPAALASVRVLTIGSHVELPLACCFRGVHSEAFPHQSFVGAAASSTGNNSSNDLGLLGAEPMKSRNNIGRRSLR